MTSPGRVADLGLRWFEEPCRWNNDRRWMRDVRHQGGRIGVCRAERDHAAQDLRDLVMDGAIDVSNFDASWAGGPTIWRKAAGLCAAFRVSSSAHHEEPQVSSHLLASVPNHTFTECFDEERDPFFWRLTDMSTRIAGGRYQLPDRPGFGIEFDWDYLRTHRGDPHQYAWRRVGRPPRTVPPAPGGWQASAMACAKHSGCCSPVELP